MRVNRVRVGRRQLAQAVTGNQRRFRMRRHFHQVNVEVEKARMVCCPRQIAKRGFEHLARFERAGAGRGLPGTQVPHTPGRTVEDRFCKDKT